MPRRPSQADQPSLDDPSDGNVERLPDDEQLPDGKTTVPSPIEYNPGPRPGFVRVYNKDLKATADIPEEQLALHKPKGWELADPDAPAPETADDDEAGLGDDAAALAAIEAALADLHPADRDALANLTDEERAVMADLAPSS